MSRPASRLLPLPLLAFALLGGGCSTTTPNPDKTATEIDPEKAKPEYWWDRPNPVRVPATSFDAALKACQHAARERFFEVDRIDAREGLVTTYPLTAAQFFEPWRRDNTTVGDVARSSLDNYRRTVRFHIDKEGPDRYVVIPQVLVERESIVGRRITSVTGFRAFAVADQTTLAELRADETAPEQNTYWYPTARDHNLEYELGKAVVNAMH